MNDDAKDGLYKTNNMKLYTEEQVRQIIHRASLNRHLTYGDVLDDITPIELPSDEEIEETFTFYPQMIEGAKWMKEQILNQNK
jgi:hypothetical protein